MNSGESDFLLSSTPPKTRSRNKFKNVKMNNTTVNDLKEWSKVQVKSPKYLRKKKYEMRSHQRDAKTDVILDENAEQENTFGDYNIIIGSPSSKNSDVLTVGSLRPLRCLSASCISDKDLNNGATEGNSQRNIGKGRKKQGRVKLPKPPLSQQIRQRYMQRLRQVVSAGNNKQCQLEIDHSRADAKLQKYQLRKNELIWLELQAWFNDRTLNEQDQVLYVARQSLVQDVLSFVSEFQYNEKYITSLNKLKDKIDTTLYKLPSEVACDECEVYVEWQAVADHSEESSESSAFNCAIEKQVAESEKNSNLIIPSIFPADDYIVCQTNAISKVGELLKLLCIIENLYPSSSALATEYQWYQKKEFQSKVQSLCCWYNITCSLRGQFKCLNRVLDSNSAYSCSQDHWDTAGLADPPEENRTKPLLSSNVRLSEFSNLINNYTNRLLKQRSVKSILYNFVKKNFSGLFRAKMIILPGACYGPSNQASCATDVDLDFSDQDESILQGEIENHGVPYDPCFSGLSVSTRDTQNNKLMKILSKIENILPLSAEELFKDKQLDFVFDESTGISPSDWNTAVFDLPSIQPLYLFFPRVMLAMMNHCMHLRMKQAMPFFNNTSGPSVLTAKQLVTESKEMLQCGVLSRDIVHFFVRDALGKNIELEVESSLLDYEKNLQNMIITYLDFVNTWFVRMLGDLSHVPRGFKDILEKEWLFAVDISPHIDFGSVILCASRFVQISGDIVNSTCEFIHSAVNALINWHAEVESPPTTLDLSCLNDESLYQRTGKEDRQMTDSSAKDTQSQSPCSLKPQAGLLWFHRQRSASPHLSRHNSQQSEPTTPLSPPSEINRFSSTSSIPGNNSLPWLQYKCVSQNDYQRRYLFELCRAVRDLFNETCERATRILSFSKILRKTLEPAIGYNMIKQSDSKQTNENFACCFCQLLKTLKAEGYILVDVSNILLLPAWTNSNLGDDIKPEKCWIDLKKYWIFIPNHVVEQGKLTESETEHVLRYLKNSLFGHLHASSAQMSYHEDSDTTKIYGVLLVKKPDVILDRRQSDVTFCAETKLSSSFEKKTSTKFQKGKPKTRSEINLFNFAPASEGVCINRCLGDQTCSTWIGNTVEISPQGCHMKRCLKILTLFCEHLEITHDVTAILACADDVGIFRKELNVLFAPFAKLAIAQMPIVRKINHSFEFLRSQVLQFCSKLMTCIHQTLNCLEVQSDKILLQKITKVGSSDMDSRHQIKSEINEIMQSCFNFGFEFIKEATRIMSGGFRGKIYKMHLELAKQWMDYVLKHRERGKGHRPRWASQGLTFIVSVDSGFLFSLTEDEFSELKQKIDAFIDHLIGESKSVDRSSSYVQSTETKLHDSLLLPESEVQILRSLSNSSSDMIRHADISFEDDRNTLPEDSDLEESDELFLPIQRVRHVIDEMDGEIDRKRMENRVIGHVSDTHKATPIVSLGIRTVNFRWQRGARVGEGAFGQVYTCVNVDTGTVLAMKQVKFQPNDHHKIRSVLDEYTNFEGIKHKNLVRYYGVELHREEMYIFMEYCDGGTLGNICEVNSLPEPMVRRYTSQILAAIHTLHLSGIVHRDIKGSNIFLTSTGVVKLGDFGSAMKLRDVSKTIPGEMITHIGTTLPYTAPEVINTSEKIGYGRSSDIWSLGCVVIEMASGKRPWHDLERVQIMFKVGTGGTPPIPDILSNEGKQFVKYCNTPDPTRRWTADQLLGHTFVKVPENDEMF